MANTPRSNASNAISLSYYEGKVEDKESAPRCTTCNAKTASLCASCGSSAYCSKACQKADWPIHKTLCREYKQFTALRPPPDDPQIPADYVLNKVALLFPVDEETPKLVWVPMGERMRVSRESGTATIEIKLFAQLKSFFGDNREDILVEARNPVRGITLTHQLVFSTRKDYMTQPVNKSIAKLTKQEASEFWRGPVVVTRQIDWESVKGENKEPNLQRLDGGQVCGGTCQDVEDMTLADLRHVIDLFLLSGNPRKYGFEG